MVKAAPQRAASLVVVAVAAIALAGCASTPRVGSVLQAPAAADATRDGPEAHPPAGLEQVPDAEPRIEAIRAGGPNKPYEALGRTYVPMTQDQPYAERGLASWYGRKFNGRRTSSGEPYDMYAMTAAHPTLPIPSYVRVRNPANGREVVLRVNDRGPFHPGRIIDLSYTAALKLDLLRGVAPVEVERITFDEIRAGTWRRPAAGETRYAAASGIVPGRTVPAVVVPAESTVAVAAGSEETRLASVPGGTAPMAADMSSLPDRTALASPVSASAPVHASPALSAASEATAASDGPSLRGYWVQLGAFRERAGALDFQRRVADALASITPRLVVIDEAALFRLQAGPYPTRDAARGAAEGMRAALSLVPVIVERR